MSQSDFIKYKRLATELKLLSKLPSVIESGQYLNFKQFQLKNTISSNKLNYEKLRPINSKNVFGMELLKAPCPTFKLCDTDSRENRRPLLGVQSAAMPLKAPPVHLTVDKLTICKHVCKLSSIE